MACPIQSKPKLRLIKKEGLGAREGATSVVLSIELTPFPYCVAKFASFQYDFNLKAKQISPARRPFSAHYHRKTGYASAMTVSRSCSRRRQATRCNTV